MSLAVTAPLDALVSFHYFSSPSVMAQLTRDDRLRLIADSGAFSAFTQGTTIRLGEYAAWLARWRHRLFWAASLDVFGDPEATRVNFLTLRDRYGLETVPTLHIGADPAHLDAYASEGVDFLGLGGMVGMPVTNALRWLVHVLRYARDHHPHMRFHGWGITAQRLLNSLPLYSVDSSGPLSYLARYGNVFLYSARTHSVHEFDTKRPDRAAQRHWRLLREYGLTPADLARVHSGNRHLLQRLSVVSTQRRNEALTRRHRVTPPTWGINPALPAPHGTRIHLVTTGDMLTLADMAPAHTVTN